MASLDQPIVIIGAGRSGSSLLGEILDAHPSIHMLGEMDMSVPMLWNCAWKTSAAGCERSRRMDIRGRELTINPRTLSEEDFLRGMNQIEHAELDRVRRLCHQFLDQLYQLSARSESHWGFKEIWVRAGNAAASWEAYDRLFPNALFVHLVRHPYQFARSAADWSRTELTPKLFQQELFDWTDYFVTNRTRASTGRYLRVPYEAIVADAATALKPLLAKLNLDWHPACLSALQKKHVPSLRRSPIPANAYKLAHGVPQLPRLAAELGYELPRKIVEKGSPPTTKADVATALGSSTWRLNPPFMPDSTHGWLAGFQMSADLSQLLDVADDLDNPRRSPVRLFENGVPLGPAHAVHWKIRHIGGGAYSHWSLAHYLLFSTSDNSDPNTNGRTYTIATKAVQSAAA